MMVAGLAIAGVVYTKSDILLEMIGVSNSVKKQATRVVANKNIENEILQEGSIHFGNLDSSMRIFINGKQVDTVGIKAHFPLDTPFSVTIRKKGHKKHEFQKTFKLTSAQPRLNLAIPELEKERVGLLSTSQNFTSGSKLIIDIDGERIEKVLPFNNMRVPAGQYEGVIANPLLGTERKVLFEIKENKRLFLE
tara:strand:- start:58 stop:636 length:579 start_codon:yes stop_codon:yes gene_type:complete